MQAIGSIETLGLIAAIEAADVMLKTADVSLVQKEFVGGGLVTVTITGDVGAVKAAIESGSVAVENFSNEHLIAKHIIPRPHDEIAHMLFKCETKETSEYLKRDSMENKDEQVQVVKKISGKKNKDDNTTNKSKS